MICPIALISFDDFISDDLSFGNQPNEKLTIEFFESLFVFCPKWGRFFIPEPRSDL